MFITLNGVRSIIFDLDALEGQHGFIQGAMDGLGNFSYAFVSRNQQRAGKLYGAEVFLPESGKNQSRFQNVIRRAITSLGSGPNNSIFVTNSGHSLSFANEVLMGTVALLNSNMSVEEQLSIYNNCPDIFIWNATDLVNSVNGAHRGYIGEFYAENQMHRFISAPQTQTSASTLRIPCVEYPDTTINACGRYFRSSDPRDMIQGLTRRILCSKSDPSRQKECFSKILGWVLSVNFKGEFDLITCVPSRPNTDNRFTVVLEQLKTNKQFVDLGKDSRVIDESILTCTRQYEPLRNLGPQERKTQVAGAFFASPAVAGKRVVVFDDVITTSSTMNECIRALKAADAAAVLPVVLGYNPFNHPTVTIDPQNDLLCPTCSGPTTTRCQKDGGSVFYTCVSLPAPGQPFHQAIDFLRGCRAKLQALHAKSIQIDQNPFNFTLIRPL